MRVEARTPDTQPSRLPLPRHRRTTPVGALVAAVLAAVLLWAQGGEPATADWSADRIVEAVNSRQVGESQRQSFVLTTTEASGRSLVREFLALRIDADDSRRSVAAITAPRLLRGTKFLTWDDFDVVEDDQWLYLRADRRTRRIASNQRGDSFFGSVFTYADIKNSLRLDREAYDWTRLPDDPARPEAPVVLEFRPLTEADMRALGFARARVWIDPQRWLPRRYEYFDVRDQLYKTSMVEDVRSVDGVWTPHRYVATLHRSGRRSSIEIRTVDYGVPVDPALLTREGLDREIRW